MNVDELIGDLAAELQRRFPDRREDLDGEDLDDAETIVEQVFKNAHEVLEEDQAEAGDDDSEGRGFDAANLPDEN